MIVGCAYYNTLFNAQEKYEEGVKKIKSSRDGEITSDIRNDFYKTIDKCWKLINHFGLTLMNWRFGNRYVNY